MWTRTWTWVIGNVAYAMTFLIAIVATVVVGIVWYNMATDLSVTTATPTPATKAEAKPAAQPAPKPAEEKKTAPVKKKTKKSDDSDDPFEGANQAPAMPKVSTASLRRDLCSDEEGVVDEAVLQLSRRPDAVPDIVEMFATGGFTMKQRAWRCLKTMGEPARLRLNQVVANPSYCEARIVAAAREIIIKGFRQGLAEESDRTFPAIPTLPEAKETPKSRP